MRTRRLASLSIVTLLLGSTCTPTAGGPDTAGLIDTLTATESTAKLREAGDGLLARRRQIAALFPEVAALIAAGSPGATAISARFAGQPGGDQDEGLSVLAYALEQIGDRSVINALAAFLNANLTGEVPATLSAVAHTILQLEGKPIQSSAAYLASEIEKAVAPYSPAAKSVRQQQLITTKQSCSREFYLLDSSGKRIKDAQGNDIRVGGTVLNPKVNEGFAGSTPSMNLSERVRTEGGTPFDYVEPQSRVTFQGEPTRRFNCAGFAFRHFVNGQQWIADPQRMFQSLNDANLLETVHASEVRKDDFVFFSTNPGAPAGHVAVVDAVESGLLSTEVSVINADGPTGMFRAKVDSEWFQRYRSGPLYYRWRDGPPRFEPVIERSKENSCFGTDLDGDGWPELVDCASAESCIDPVIGGIQPNPGFRAWRVTNYGSAPGGYITVLRGDADQNPPLLRSLAGGGTSPTLRAVLTSLTDSLPTSDQVVDSLCDRVSGFFRPPLASFVLQATFDGQVVSIDSIFQQRCPD